jgi:hypothetical protein
MLDADREGLASALPRVLRLASRGAASAALRKSDAIDPGGARVKKRAPISPELSTLLDIIAEAIVDDIIAEQNATGQDTPAPAVPPAASPLAHSES